MERDELKELWSRVIQGESLSAADEEQLCSALSKNENLRAEFLKDEQLDGALQALGRSHDDGAAFARQFADRVRAEGDGKRFISRVRRSVQAAGEKRQAISAEKVQRPSSRASRRLQSARESRQKRGWLWPMAMAASVAAIAGTFAWRSLHPPPHETAVAPPQQQTPEPEIVAEIIALRGTVALVNARGRQSVIPGSAVHRGESLETPVAGMAEVRLKDGSVIELLESSRLSGIDLQSGVRVSLAAGSLRAQVTKRTEESAFIVATANAETKVIGTKFTHATRAGQDRLEVSEGKVAFTRLTDKTSIDVSEGMYAIVAPDVQFAARPLGKPLGDVVSVDGNPVDAVCYSPDGKLILAGCHDNSVRIWEIASSEMSVLGGHTERVRSVAISSDGTRIASASWDGTIKLWDTASRKELFTLQGHTGNVWSVAFTPDGKTLASAGFDKTIRLWDTQSGKQRSSFDPGLSEVLTLTFSRDGKHLAAGGTGSVIKIWNADTMKELRMLRGHTHVILSLAFSPDGTLLASGSQDKSIRLWDVASGQTRRSFSGHSDEIRAVTFDKAGRRLLSGSVDHTIKLWDVLSGAEIKTFSGHGGWVSSISLSPDGAAFVTGSYDSTLRRWTLPK